MSDGSKGSVLSGMFWMFLISVLLFWLPVFGALIAGIVGGMKAGGVINGLTAALIPGMVLGIALYVVAAALSGLPLLGAIAGASGLVLSLLHIGPLLVGALVGGFLA
ncbi:MAG: hypothetical protein O7G83_06085 [Proteobacteria bacterium]|nr:hypothetical protein [Pseudomonadota bacterium]MCZ6892978.1 hypothetical protein [Gammaproteobacteria bacterium]